MPYVIAQRRRQPRIVSPDEKSFLARVTEGTQLVRLSIEMANATVAHRPHRFLAHR